MQKILHDGFKEWIYETLDGTLLDGTLDGPLKKTKRFHNDYFDLYLEKQSELSNFYMKPTSIPTYLTPNSIPTYLTPNSLPTYSTPTEVPTYLPPPPTFSTSQHFYSAETGYKKASSKHSSSMLTRTLSGFLEGTKIMSLNTVSLPLPVCKFLDACKLTS